MSFAATWMDLEILTLNAVRERQISYNITFMWNLKYDTHEPTKYKQIHRHRKQTYGYQREGGWDK